VDGLATKMMTIAAAAAIDESATTLSLDRGARWTRRDTDTTSLRTRSQSAKCAFTRAQSTSGRVSSTYAATSSLVRCGPSVIGCDVLRLVDTTSPSSCNGRHPTFFCCSEIQSYC